MQEMSALKTATTLVVRDPRYLEHDPGFGHPESPDRLKVIYERLDYDDVQGLFKYIVPRSAGRDELLWNHTGDYIDRIGKTAFKISTVWILIHLQAQAHGKQRVWLSEAFLPPWMR